MADKATCQICGEEVTDENAFAFRKRNANEDFMAVICIDHILSALGLEWKKVERKASPILVPHVGRLA